MYASINIVYKNSYYNVNANISMGTKKKVSNTDTNTKTNTTIHVNASANIHIDNITFVPFVAGEVPPGGRCQKAGCCPFHLGSMLL